MELKRTALFSEHQRLGARLVPFAGWEMPVQYSGVIKEHEAVRKAAGIFDVSHMGEIFVEGEEAGLALEELTCNKVAALYDGKAQYSAITNQHGGVIDDIIVYRISAEKFLVCVNASNADKDFSWFSRNNKRKATFIDKSQEYGLIALQGPKAVAIVKKLEALRKLSELKYFHFDSCELFGVQILAARTGYTGEDGYEFFVPVEKSADLWRLLLEAGEAEGLLPCGLGARDSLRLEAAYPLHGHELSEDLTAVESGLGWIVKEDKPEYPGKDLLVKQKKTGAARKLIGFYVSDRGIAREGSKVLDAKGDEIGFVTSGTKTPGIDKPLGLAIVDSRHSAQGEKIQVVVRDKLLAAEVCSLPFYKRG